MLLSRLRMSEPPYHSTIAMVAVPSSSLTGVRQELTAIHTDDRLAVLLVGVTEALIDELLRGEGLDDTQPAECLLDLTDELPPTGSAPRGWCA